LIARLCFKSFAVHVAATVTIGTTRLVLCLSRQRNCTEEH